MLLIKKFVVSLSWEIKPLPTDLAFSKSLYINLFIKYSNHVLKTGECHKQIKRWNSKIKFPKYGSISITIIVILSWLCANMPANFYTCESVLEVSHVKF